MHISIRKLAYNDLLCGCYNRNYLEYKLTKHYKNKETYITIVDLDSFKQINDIYGHQAGDKILRILASIIKSYYGVSQICRYGGDEFIIFHKSMINFKILQKKFTESTGFTFSFGTAFKHKDDRFDDVLLIADKKLYKEKNVNMNNSMDLPNLVWFFAMNKQLTNEEWNSFCKRVSEAKLENEIFKTSQLDYSSYVKDFLDGKYIIIRKDS